MADEAILLKTVPDSDDTTTAFEMTQPTAAETQPTILIVDDDDILRERLARAMDNRGYQVHQANGFDAAIEILEAAEPDRAIVDLKMPGKSGLELLRELKRLSPNTEVIVLTGYGSIANAVDAIKLGAINYVTKPADAVDILAAFEPAGSNDSPSSPEEIGTRSLAEAEWEHIHRVLADCSGNISEAARRLDIPRRTLQRKLKKLSP